MARSGSGKREYRRDNEKALEIFSFRMRPKTRMALEKLAAASGRTLGGEIEASIERSFALSGNKSATYAVMSLIAESIDGLVRLRPQGKRFAQDKGATWLTDPYLHQQA